METLQTDDETLIRGKQRIAVYQATALPRTGKQILELTHAITPRMTYQDLRHILRSFSELGLVQCLNPDAQTGRLYQRINAPQNPETSPEVINLVATLSRSKLRLAVLREIARERLSERNPLTATVIRKRLLESYPMGLNHTLSALSFLESHKLIEAIDYTEKRASKIYNITELGHNVLAHIHDTNNLFSRK